MDALTHLTVAEQCGLLSSGAVTPGELVDAALARVAEVQPVLNCFVEVWGDAARERARSLGSPDNRPLFGVPVAIKDTTPWSGHRVTYGSRLYGDNVAQTTAIVVERLLAAGAVIIGSTTAPEFAHAGITDSPMHGPTRNPWDPSRTTGGSSGGSAAAVASGCVALAEGSDMGGSVRIPAAWCGVVGLKPSLGRIPMDVLPGLWDTISHHGPLARSVECARAFLAATGGPSLRDPWSNVGGPQGTGAEPASLRVAWTADLGNWSVHPHVAAAVGAAVEELRGTVASVTEAPALFGQRDHDLWVEMWGIFMAAYYGERVDLQPGDADPDVVSLVRLGRRFSAVEAKQMEIERSAAWRRVAAVLEEHDVIVCPTMSRPPGPASKSGVRGTRGAAPPDGLVHSEDMTSVWNLLAPLPVVSVPCGRHTGADNGLPIGLQIVGRPGREDTVLALAAHIERVTGSASWRPPV